MSSVNRQSVCIDESPPAGTECRPCRRAKHYCPARVYLGDEPACGACAKGVECETMQALRRLKEPWDEAPEEYHPAPVRTIDPSTVLPPPHIPRVIDVIFAPPPAPPPSRKEKPMRPRDRNRPLCKAEGCTYSAAAKGSFCTKKHYSLLQKELRGDGTPKALAAEAAAKRHHTHPAPHEVPHDDDQRAGPLTENPVVAVNLTLRLTEQQCDALYNRCTPEQKATALSSLLHQMLAI